MEPRGSTTPMPEIVTSVAFRTSQLNVLWAPRRIVLGAAVKFAMIGGSRGSGGATVIVTLWLIVRFGLRAVRVYVVVSVGLTVVLPPSGWTSPIPEISTFVALRTSQTSVAASPTAIRNGAAEKRRTVIGGSGGATVIVTLWLIVRFGLRAVRVYVVVSVGLTVVLPPSGWTSPIPEISTFVALRTSQTSVAASPTAIRNGAAEKRRTVIGGSGGATVIVTLWLIVRFGLRAVRVYVVVSVGLVVLPPSGWTADSGNLHVCRVTDLPDQ